MFPLFHVAVPLLAFEIPYIKRKYAFNRLALIIGSLLPDLIDKSLMFLGLGSGRGFSHTLLFAVVFYAITFLILKRKTIIPNSLVIGILFHLLLDLPEIPLFFPFIDYQFIYLEDPLGGWLFSLLNDPIVQVTEVLGILFLITILFHNKLYGVRKIFTFITDSNVNQKLQD
ncbi:MAG: metal-dependent hydrolase [Promethearchaeota archaeon]